jgi:hypothetical protein
MNEQHKNKFKKKDEVEKVELITFERFMELIPTSILIQVRLPNIIGLTYEDICE